VTQGLVNGPPEPTTCHLCVDMQRIFAAGAPWEIPWMNKVVPRISAICARHAPATIFTRFIPPASQAAAQGTWKHYYQKWPQMTRDQLDPSQLDLIPELAPFVPPAQVVDKSVYSPWHEGALEGALAALQAETVVVTGGETDVCVLATVIGAVDRGLRVILVADAVCSSTDDTHDAIMELYRRRYGVQIETITTHALMKIWSSHSPSAAEGRNGQ
jgi:nicotinamidase-related amidase